VSKEWSPEDIFEVLASRTARDILLESSGREMSARKLSEACRVSKPTVYRRLNELRKYDLLEQDVAIDREGNHYQTYETNVDRICFDIEDREFVVTVRFQQDLVDRFISSWERFGQPENGEA